MIKSPFVRRSRACAALLAAMAAAGCNSKPAPPAVCSAPQGSSSAAQSLASADTSFALSFYPPAVTAAGAGKNVSLSPFSASAALTMLDVGAAGNTAKQIETMLHLPGSGATSAPAYASLACTLETDGSSNGNQLSIANSLWGQKGFPFLPSFLSVLADGYSAPLQQVDFGADPGGATTAIDQWVSTGTEGKIPTLFQPGDIDSSTRLVLVNAIYFRGAWATAFDASATSPQPFTLGDGSIVSVPTMSGAVSIAQGGGPGFSVVELPYQGGALAMDFLLPATQLSTLEASLTAADLEAALRGLPAVSEVSLLLPKFAFSTRVVLNNVLSGLGMPDAFTTLANFSGADGAHDLSLALVVQQAVVEVDEQGTVAAAATGISAEDTSAEIPLAIDHPFLFLIRDTKTGSILFMGRVEDPRAGS
jgi:serpin B